MANETVGYVHSIYTGGMVDGPGIRTVVFLAGCSLRCMYCHNPDTWFRKHGKSKTVDEVIEEAAKYRSYYKFSGGGVTISGGEPTEQPVFLKQLLIACRENNIHTALDTSGFAKEEIAEEILPHVDLLMLDYKAFNPKLYLKITGQKHDRQAQTLEIAEKLKVPTMIRFVLVPGLTDDLDDLHKMAAFLKQCKNIEKIEILPFHKHGEWKWEKAHYQLHDTHPPTPEQLEEVQRIFA